MPADCAEVNRTHDVHALIAELSRKGGERSRLVIEAHDKHGPRRACVARFHESLARLHRLIDDQAHVRPPACRLGADRVDVDSCVTEDRGELREFSGTVRHVDVDLDHAPPSSEIAFRGYKRFPPSKTENSLSGRARLSNRLSCDTASRMSESRFETWTVPSASTVMSWACGSSVVSTYRRRVANGRNSAARNRTSCWNSTGTPKIRHSFPGHTGTGTNLTTLPSRARTSRAHTRNCSRKVRASGIRRSSKIARSSRTSRIRTGYGSSSRDRLLRRSGQTSPEVRRRRRQD